MFRVNRCYILLGMLINLHVDVGSARCICGEDNNAVLYWGELREDLSRVVEKLHSANAELGSHGELANLEAMFMQLEMKWVLGKVFEGLNITVLALEISDVRMSDQKSRMRDLIEHINSFRGGGDEPEKTRTRAMHDLVLEGRRVLEDLKGENDESVSKEFVVEEAEEVALKTREDVFAPLQADAVLSESHVLRSIGDPDYRFDDADTMAESQDDLTQQSFPDSANFGELAPPASTLPPPVLRLFDSVNKMWGLGMLNPDRVPSQMSSRTDLPPACVAPTDAHLLATLVELWAEREPSGDGAATASPGLLHGAGTRFLEAAAAFWDAGLDRPLFSRGRATDAEQLHALSVCLPLYALAALASTWGPALPAEAGCGDGGNASLVRDGVRTLNFAWLVLSHEDRLAVDTSLVSLRDVIAEHARWMAAYARCFGAARSKRLADRIPVKYGLRSPLVRGAYTAEETALLEHLEPAGYDHSLGSFPVSFVLLPSLPSVQQEQQRQSVWRRVLVDAGAGGFHLGTKLLLDMYSVVSKFDEALLIDVRAGSIQVPPAYAQAYNISVRTAALRVGTRDARSDLLSMLSELQLTPEDFVVLKFDCDLPGTRSSMEWGFLADLLLRSPAHLAVVDEIFVELHFFYPDLWGSNYLHHSMWQAFDLMRQLRHRGIAVHAWP